MFYKNIKTNNYWNILLYSFIVKIYHTNIRIMKLVILFYKFSYLIKSFQDHFRNLFVPEDAQDQPLWPPGTKDYFGG